LELRGVKSVSVLANATKENPMHIVLGATGHIGSAVASSLLESGETVIVGVRDPQKAEALRKAGATIKIVDVRDVENLRAIFAEGKRLFLLNPPADPSGDTDVAERETISSILAAIKGSALERIVAESTYGAQSGRQIGDLGVLWEMEQALAGIPISTTIIRAAYYMSNWDASLETARRDSVVHTLFPEDFRMPMVAPADIGRVAAALMAARTDRPGLQYVEGPRRYSVKDVADAFGQALGKPVRVVTTARDEWVESFVQLGFSKAAAASYAGMTAAALAFEPPNEDEVDRGLLSLADYVKSIC
jgi:uncharacterized protein YbjT (DUF2867 family)